VRNGGMRALKKRCEIRFRKGLGGLD